MCNCNESPFNKLRESWSRHFDKDSHQCSCCCQNATSRPKVKGKFGVAYVIETPSRKCKPCGWEVEFNDTPSQIESNCRKMMNWITCPPLGECQENRAEACCCSQAPDKAQQAVRQICGKQKHQCKCPPSQSYEEECCCKQQQQKQQCCHCCVKKKSRKLPQKSNKCCCNRPTKPATCCCKKLCSCNSNSDDSSDEECCCSKKCPCLKEKQDKKKKSKPQDGQKAEEQTKQSKNSISPPSKPERSKTPPKTPLAVVNKEQPKKEPDKLVEVQNIRETLPKTPNPNQNKEVLDVKPVSVLEKKPETKKIVDNAPPINDENKPPKTDTFMLPPKRRKVDRKDLLRLIKEGKKELEAARPTPKPQ